MSHQTSWRYHWTDAGVASLQYRSFLFLSQGKRCFHSSYRTSPRPANFTGSPGICSISNRVAPVPCSVGPVWCMSQTHRSPFRSFMYRWVSCQSSLSWSSFPNFITGQVLRLLCCCSSLQCHNSARLPCLCLRGSHLALRVFLLRIYSLSSLCHYQAASWILARVVQQSVPQGIERPCSLKNYGLLRLNLRCLSGSRYYLVISWAK